MPTYSSFNALGSSIETGELTDEAVTYAKISGVVGQLFPVAVGFCYHNGQFSVTAGTWNTQFDAGTSTISLTNDSASADNDRIDYAEVYLPSGTYTFHLICRNNTNAGKVDLLIDDVSKGTIDMYAISNSQFNDETITSIAIATGGTFKISLKINGKNASSSDYHIHIQNMFFEKTA